MSAKEKISMKVINAIRNDTQLTPLFIDYIAENMKMTMATFYKVEEKELIKFKVIASRSLKSLIAKLEGRVEEKQLYDVIEKVCEYYSQFIVMTGGGIANVE